MIIQIEELRALKSIGINVDPQKLYPFCEEVEKHIVLPAISPALYNEVETHRNDERFRTLLHGGYYTKDATEPNACYLRGLIVAIGYLAYSRAVIQGEATLTNFGLRQKISDYSDKVDERTLIRVSNDNRKYGDECLRQCLDYIDCCCKSNKKTNSISRQRYRAIHKKKI